MYYKLVIDKTAKPMGRTKEDWQLYDHEVKEFKTLKLVREYLKDAYFYCKTKYKTFNDGIEGQTGWIYAFRSDPSAYGEPHLFEQHWVNVYKIHSKPILI
jgi:hypothetical protein